MDDDLIDRVRTGQPADDELEALLAGWRRQINARRLPPWNLDVEGITQLIQRSRPASLTPVIVLAVVAAALIALSYAAIARGSGSILKTGQRLTPLRIGETPVSGTLVLRLQIPSRLITRWGIGRSLGELVRVALGQHHASSLSEPPSSSASPPSVNTSKSPV